MEAPGEEGGSLYKHGVPSPPQYSHPSVGYVQPYRPILVGLHVPSEAWCSDVVALVRKLGPSRLSGDPSRRKAGALYRMEKFFRMGGSFGPAE